MTLLLTAFEPFGGEALNPTKMMLEELDTSSLNGNIIKVILPTSFKGAKEKLLESLKEYEPDVVISLGQAENRTNISLERVAINVMDARIKDNDGDQPRDLPIKEEGETAFFATLPLRGIEDALHLEKIPCSISNTAGTYVCNMVMYLALDSFKDSKKRAGFIHVPMTHEQVLKRSIPSMSMDTLMKGLKTILETVLKEEVNE